MVPYSQTYGALLVGGLLALFLSGIVSTQTYLYQKTYAADRTRNKFMVGIIWILDLAHSSFVIASVFHYLVGGYSDPTAIRFIAWPVSVTISITGFLTFLIHIFFTHRVWTLSKGNRWLTGIIATLAFLRMLSAFGTVIQMHRFKTWVGFHHGAAWSFTTGLAISATVDMIIAFSLLFYLQKRRTGFSSMDQIIDSIMVYTIENGMLTSVLTVASFVCWLTMSHNFIFLALHFCISKTYANSFLATLNARSHLKERSTSSGERNNSIRLPTLFSSKAHNIQSPASPSAEMNQSNTLQITVEKTVHCVTDVESDDIEYVGPAYIPRGNSGDLPFTDLAKV